MSAAYISLEDYLPKIRRERLDQIVEAADEDEDVILDTAEEEAIAQIRLFLDNYYNMDAEFAKSGNQRNKIVKRWAMNLVVFYIYERVPDDMVPERVVKNYDDTLDMLEAINGADKNVPGLLPKTETNCEGETSPKTRRRWGSLPKRSNDGGNPSIRN